MKRTVALVFQVGSQTPRIDGLNEKSGNKPVAQEQTLNTNGVTPAKRVFAYCHDSVGIGHLARTLAVCRKIGSVHPATTFLLVTGTPYVPLMVSDENVDFLKLPALKKINNSTYAARNLSFSPEQVIACRESLLLATVQHFKPDLLLVDKAPVGVCGELKSSLKWMRQNMPASRMVFGMRDIEDGADVTRAAWEKAGIPDVLEACFDEVWVYGMRDVFDVGSEYRLSSSISDKLNYVGYVAPEPCGHEPSTDTDSDRVLVTVGGGTDGDSLLRKFLSEAAGRVVRRGLKITLVGGPDLPKAARGSLQQLSEGMRGVEWVDFEKCMDCRVRSSRLIVSMGGYNTLTLIARNRKPVLVVPRTTPRVEQSIRARLWSDFGAGVMEDPTKLTPNRLADRVLDLIEHGPRETHPRLDLGGLDRVGCRVQSWWREENAHASALHL